MTKRTPKGEGSVYQRASDGKWCASVTLASGRRKVVYGTTERAVLKARRELLKEIEAGRPVPLGRTPTLGDYLTRWLDVRLASEVESGHLDESTAGQDQASRPASRRGVPRLPGRRRPERNTGDVAAHKVVDHK